MVLWALFTDAIEGLADEEATHSEAADATILVTLESAQGDNVIVIPGSPDARDTLGNDCGRTPPLTLSKPVIAGARAGAISFNTARSSA